MVSRQKFGLPTQRSTGGLISKHFMSIYILCLGICLASLASKHFQRGEGPSRGPS